MSTLIEEHELPAWTSKLYAKQAGFAVAVAKSHRWPGAYSAVSTGWCRVRARGLGLGWFGLRLGVGLALTLTLTPTPILILTR